MLSVKNYNEVLNTILTQARTGYNIHTYVYASMYIQII